MPKIITAHQRLEQAKELIQKARQLPTPPELGYRDLSFVAQVKNILRQARDLIKFIQYSPSLTPELKQETMNTLNEILKAEKEILHINTDSK